MTGIVNAMTIRPFTNNLFREVERNHRSVEVDDDEDCDRDRSRAC